MVVTVSSIIGPRTPLPPSSHSSPHPHPCIPVGLWAACLCPPTAPWASLQALYCLKE